ncbi:hypothetical protein ACI0X9_003299 [Cronobacter turicensis]
MLLASLNEASGISKEIILSKYETLDALILQSINERPKSFSDIYLGAEHGSSEIHLICQELCGPGGEPSRVLDRRLQALRKKALIVFMKGWRKI